MVAAQEIERHEEERSIVESNSEESEKSDVIDNKNNEEVKIYFSMKMSELHSFRSHQRSSLSGKVDSSPSSSSIRNVL